MKRITVSILVLIMMFSVVGCGKNEKTTTPQEATVLPASTTTTTANTDTKETQSPIEALNEQEKQLFDALILITKADFYEPSAVKVLEIGDYQYRTKYKEDDSYDLLYGPDTVIVRLQGENRVGGTLNHYYIICINSGENESSTAQSQIENYRNMIKTNQKLIGVNELQRNGSSKEEAEIIEAQIKLMKYVAEFGEYIELPDGYEISKDASKDFDIGNINRALKAYWEEMGF